MSFTMKAVVGVTVAAACLSATACGGSSDPLAGMTGKQIAAKAMSDLKSAPSFTLTGTGIPFQGKTATMSVGMAGKDCTMSVDIGSAGTMTMVMIGTSAWMKADADFLKTEDGSDGSAIAFLVAGKYLKIPASSMSGLTQGSGVCDRNGLDSSLSGLSPSSNVTKGTPTTVNGQKVYPLADKADKTTFYVTDTSTPWIIKFVDTKSGEAGQATITYGVPKSITAPSASETVSLP
jgi:hypothetical protein